MKDFERIDRVEREQYFIQQILVRILDVQIQMHELVKQCVEKNLKWIAQDVMLKCIVGVPVNYAALTVMD